MTAEREHITQAWHNADQWEEWPRELDERETYLESAYPARRLTPGERNELHAIGQARQRFEAGEARRKQREEFDLFTTQSVSSKLNWVFQLLQGIRDGR